MLNDTAVSQLQIAVPENTSKLWKVTNLEFYNVHNVVKIMQSLSLSLALCVSLCLSYDIPINLSVFPSINLSLFLMVRKLC